MKIELLRIAVVAMPFLMNIGMFLVFCGIKKKWKITLGDGYWGWVFLSLVYSVLGYWLFDLVTYENEIELIILLLFFLAASVGLVVMSFMERIIYDEEGFYTGFSLLKKEKYLYRDISSYRMSEKGYVLNVNTKFLEWRKIKEVEDFMQYAVEQSQKACSSETTEDWNYGTEDSYESVVLRQYFILTKIANVVLVLGFVIFLCMALIDVNENNAQYVEGKITEWYREGESWYFHVEGLEKELKIAGAKNELTKKQTALLE